MGFDGFESGLSAWTTSGRVFATDFEYSRDFLGLPQEPLDGIWDPTEGAYFASLWSTDSAGTDLSSMSRTFSGEAGVDLSFDYFFDFGDVATYPDSATATLTWSTGSAVLFEHNTPGHELGDDQNINWTPLSFTLPETGVYTLEFLVADSVGSFESILGVDNVNVVPIPGAALLGAFGLGSIVVMRRRLSSSGR